MLDRASRAKVTQFVTLSFEAVVALAPKSALAADKLGYGKATLKDDSMLSSLATEESKSLVAESLA
jgi:hypothetical protein